MKKLFIIGAVLTVVVGAVAGMFALVAAITRPAESYAEQQARLAREAQSAEFWQWVVKIIVVLVAISILTAITLIWSSFSHKRKMELLRFQEDRMRLKPDQNGNYDVRFDRQGETIRIRPGNKPFAEPPVFVNGAMPNQLPAGRSGGNAGKGMTVRRNQEPIAYYSVRDIQPEQLEAPAADRGVNLPTDLQASEVDLPNLQPEIYGKFTDLLPEMERYIREGRGKTETLKALGLVGRYYKEAGPVYDDLAAKFAKEQA